MSDAEMQKALAAANAQQAKLDRCRHRPPMLGPDRSPVYGPNTNPAPCAYGGKCLCDADDNMPAEIWAYEYPAPVRGILLRGWDRDDLEPDSNRYIRPPRWRTVGEDGMPEHSRELMLCDEHGRKRHVMSDGHDFFLVERHHRIRQRPDHRWIYLDEVLR